MTACSDELSTDNTSGSLEKIARPAARRRQPEGLPSCTRALTRSRRRQPRTDVPQWSGGPFVVEEGLLAGQPQC